MPKQKIEIEIDIPEGYEFVAHRKALHGETYINNHGNISVWTGGKSHGVYSIVRKTKPPFQWPAWLKAAAIAKDESGYVCAYSIEPAFRDGYWIGKSDAIVLNYTGIFNIDLSWFNSVKPEHSLVLNPNLKAGEHV